MKLIGELYKPDIAFLPIGDRFTMGPDTAAMAAQWLGVKQVVPMHCGTFPLLTGTPASARSSISRDTGIRGAELQARRNGASRSSVVSSAVQSRRPGSPRTRRRSGPTSSGPPGSNHFAIQFTAPIIANSIIFGSPGLNRPWSMPCWMMARMPWSNSIALGDHALQQRRRQRLAGRASAPCRAARRGSCARTRGPACAASRPATTASACTSAISASSMSSEYSWQAKRISSLF